MSGRKVSSSSRGRVRSMLIDLDPVRTVPVFRRYWIGKSLSTLGSQMTGVAVLFQIWAATGNPLWAGAIGLAHVIPIALLSVAAGSAADRFDRRRIQIITTTGQCVLAGVLTLQAFLGGWSPFLLLVLVGLQTCFATFGGPASRSVIPRLLPPEKVAAGMALTGIGFQLTMLAGPALAGLMIGWVGVQGCYLIDAVTFGASFIGVFGLPVLRPEGTARPGWQGVREGFDFVLKHRVVRSLLLIDLAATVLAMPIALFPLLNEQLFDGDPATFGLFLSAIGAGGMLASIFSGSFTRSSKQSSVVVLGALLWGASLALLGAMSIGWVALLLLAVAGAADTASVVSRGAMVQRVTPDAVRGRVSAVELLVGMGGPDLGNARAGLVARFTGAQAALLIGGLSCAALVSYVARRVPELRPGTVPRHRSAAPADDDFVPGH